MIKAIQLTNLTCNLINSDLLKNRLNMAKLPVEKSNKLIYELFHIGVISQNEIIEDKNIERLTELGFIRKIEIEDLLFENLKEKVLKSYKHFPIKNIEAMNFELTYDCNSNCPHCILKSVRKSFHGNELSYECVQRIIADAYFAGLLQNGINFTGGEALLAKTDIFELIRYASSYGIPTRLFTNSFWGNKLFFKAANRRFTSPLSLIKKFKSSGLNQLSLSFDSRFDKDKVGVKQLSTIIQACETIGLHYEIISSPEIREHLNKFIEYLKLTLGINHLKYMTPITMELVDMGGAISFNHNNLSDLSLKELIDKSLCKSKGYFQPKMLTIAPNGDVRSCMYGLGLNNLGNIHKSNLLDVINDFEDEVSIAFAEKQAFELADIIYEPYKEIYKPFSHPCSACVLLARLLQEYFMLKKKKDFTNKQFLQMNYKVANDLNLLKDNLKLKE
jgi:MoaA/NifB/PqqE/SkfB family radical SAM enzyme